MRHRKRGRKLGRNASHRKAMFRNMANSLFEHEAIVTTVAKAKELRPFAEKMITLARRAATLNRDARKLREKAADHDARAATKLEEANRLGLDTEKGKAALAARRDILKERYDMLAEWRKAVAPVLHVRRMLISRLGNYRLPPKTDHDTIIQKLIDDIGLRFETRLGGYTRIHKLVKRRLGDASHTAMISLVSDDGGPVKRKKSADEAASKTAKKSAKA